MMKGNFLLLILLLLPILLPPWPAAAGIGDLENLPQDVSAYLAPAESRQDLPLWPDQKALAADYLTRYFAPWDGGKWVRPRADAFWIIDWLKGNQLFGENRLPLPPSFLENLVRQAAVETYPSLDLRGITIRDADVRALPTHRPGFRDFAIPGEGFPFDYFQNSALAANTPLRIRHRSLDGSWLYVEAGAVYGWLPADEVALVDDAFVHSFRAAAPLVLIRDAVPISDTAGIFRFTGRLGAVLPMAKAVPGGYRVLIAAADADRRAVLRKATLAAAAAAPFPLAGTPSNFAAVANRLLGQMYGWGGLYGDRDCSATLRDLFAVFGLYLPRNSARQAETGRAIPLDKLTPEEKERVILREAVPLRTLLWMNGHVMLYLGNYRGQAAVLHTFWGVRTRDDRGDEGRIIVGRTVITTLQPGRELADRALPESDLRWRLRGMTLLGRPSLPPLAAASGRAPPRRRLTRGQIPGGNPAQRRASCSGCGLQRSPAASARAPQLRQAKAGRVLRLRISAVIPRSIRWHIWSR